MTRPATRPAPPSTEPVTDPLVDPAALRRRRYSALFAIDLWERFGFYGLQAILVLYAAAPSNHGGLGLSMSNAAALFAAWISVTFMLSLPGGWLADRWLGGRTSVWLGGSIGTVGYLLMALPGTAFGPIGLGVSALGIGLYKPSQQMLINSTFDHRGRRESGISLIYVGIQLSALLAPLLVGYLGERVNWHLGFAVAGIAVLLGVLHFGLSHRAFDTLGGPPVERERPKTWWVVAAAVLVALIVAGAVAGVLTPSGGIVIVGLVAVVLPVVAFVVLHRNRALERADRRRLRSFLWLFLAWAVFWLMIAQDSSVLTLFARDAVDRNLGGFTIPTSWMQSATPFFMLVLAPVFAMLLPRIGRSRSGVPIKLAAGLLLTGVSFLLLSGVAGYAAQHGKVSPIFLLIVYLMHACGELVVSAAGIAATADVLPPAFMTRMLGLLWLFAAMGSGVGAKLASSAEQLNKSGYFLVLGGVAFVCGVLFVLFRTRIGKALRPDSEQAS